MSDLLLSCPRCGDDSELSSPDARPGDADHLEYECLTCGHTFKYVETENMWFHILGMWNRP